MSWLNFKGNSLFVFGGKFFILFLSLILFAGLVSAIHNSTVDLQPEWTVPNSLNNYTATFNNLAGSDENIDEVRIYMNQDYTYTVPPCEAKAGWDLYFISAKQACMYVAADASAVIQPGQSTDFNFSATAPASGCEFFWDFETRDETFPNDGSIVYLEDVTKIDNTPPTTTKVYGTPYFPEGINTGASYPHWIAAFDSDVTLTAVDGAENCAIGVKELHYRDFVVEDDSICVTEQACNPDNYVQYSPDGGWTIVDTETVTFFKEEESCHVIEFFAVDQLGNEEPLNYQCVYVDDTPPVVEKTHGEGMISDYEEQLGEFDWTTTQIPIYLDCTDTGNHPVNNVSLYYRIWDDLSGTWAEWTDTTGSEVHKEVYFNEESVHKIQYYCVDVLGNSDGTVEEPYEQTYRVDDTPPTITKTMLGEAGVDWMGDCPPQDESDECFVADNGRGGVAISVSDPDPTQIGCNSGNTYCTYGVWWHTAQENCNGQYNAGRCLVDSGEFIDYKEIIFAEDSTHDLYVFCWDALENKSSDVETFLVDSTPPVTTKTYGIPAYPANINDGGAYPHFITSQTSIDFSAEDNKVGVNKTFWRYSVVEDIWCESEASGCQNYEGVLPDFIEYTDTVSLPEESCHIIEFYSVDKLGNTEETNRQCVFVDNTEPLIDKTVGDPKIECIEDPLNCDYYITQQTPITLTCADQTPHPVDIVSTEYRYRISNDCLEWSEWTDWTTSEGEQVRIFFEEDSCHELEYKCEDILGNSTITFSEIDVVDTVGPDIETEIVGPQIELACNQTESYYEMCEGWSCLGEGEKDFFTTGRSDTTNWDVAIWNGNPEQVESSGEFAWINEGEPVPFEVNYDPTTGLVSYNVNGTELTWIYDSEKAFEYLVLFVKGGTEKGDVLLSDVYVNGMEIGDIYSSEAYKGARVYLSDADQINGFTATGFVSMTWFEGHPQEIPAFHVFAMNTHEPTETTCMYIDGITEIEVITVDPEPHPVNDVECEWSYTLDENETVYGPFDVFPINFPEECKHNLTITCKDALGNETTKEETYYVDKTPPETTKEYGVPFYEEDGKEWITSNTPITLTAEDIGPHKTGIAETHFRITQVNNNYCDPENEEFVCGNAEGTGAWMTYFEAFSVSEQSCHLIEYYSVDNVNKTETTKKQCVYVDNTPPEPNKLVGEPKSPWNGMDSAYYDLEEFCLTPGNCWKVTLLTPVSLDCTDPEPHPVNHSSAYFYLELDGSTEFFEGDYEGQNITEVYCEFYEGDYNSNGDGFCDLGMDETEFFFLEESEHNLQYYCVDALGNAGEIDDEKFKVEGTKFEIELNKKWNLISVPFSLIDDSIETVFESVADNVESVWTYDAFADEWHAFYPGSPATDLTEILPGWGYWVRAYEADTMILGGSLFSPATTPSDKQLAQGWNLIGHFGTQGEEVYDGPNLLGEGRPAYCALYSLGSTFMDKGWTSLLTYWEADNPYQWKELMYESYMNPGAGYWIFTPEEELYAYTTNCGGY